jgi:hypothetical protein
MQSVSDITNSIWTRNSSLIRISDTDTNLTTAMAAIIKESDFIYGKKNCIVHIWNSVLIVDELPNIADRGCRVVSATDLQSH